MITFPIMLQKSGKLRYTWGLLTAAGPRLCRKQSVPFICTCSLVHHVEKLARFALVRNDEQYGRKGGWIRAEIRKVISASKRTTYAYFFFTSFRALAWPKNTAGAQSW